MADLTEEQKIVIGVCVAVAALVLIGIIIFTCCIFYRKKQRVKRHHHKERIIDYQDKRPYTTYESKYTNGYMNGYTNGYGPPPYDPVPIPGPTTRREVSREIMYDNPPPNRRTVVYERPPPVRREVIYKRPMPIEPIGLGYDREWDRRSEPPVAAVEKRYMGEMRRNGAYRNDPIVIPLTKPQFIYAREGRRRSADTIYLKYNDDQALLPETNVVRRSEYAGGYAPGLRRSRSVHEMRMNQPYVGEWYRKNDNLGEFNEGAARAGRDPFLWRNQRN